MRGRHGYRIVVLAGIGSLVVAVGFANAQELDCKTLRGSKAVAAMLAHRSVHELGSLPCGVEVPVADECEVVDVEGIAETASTVAAACNRISHAAQCKLAAAAFRTTCRLECEEYHKTIATAQSCKGLARPKVPPFSGNCPIDPESGNFVVECVATGTCVCDP